jgi:hypothetical protein
MARASLALAEVVLAPDVDCLLIADLVPLNAALVNPDLYFIAFTSTSEAPKKQDQ